MVDQALFSSFSRPGPRGANPVQDSPSGIAPQETAVPLDTAEPAGDGAEMARAAADDPSAEAGAMQEDVPAFARQDLSASGLHSDQLGLIHPDVITLRASLPNSPAVELEATSAGIYRPAGFRAAPWDGFAYDGPRTSSSGLAAGTRILTARGEVEVEKLVPGDAAMALRGRALLPISWIGRAVAAAPPIWIGPGALGPDVPRRALRLGPDHPVFLGEEPVAAHTLVNGTTIRRVEDDQAELFHIDVGRAEVIFAEGLALSSSHGASNHLL